MASVSLDAQVCTVVVEYTVMLINKRSLISGELAQGLGLQSIRALPCDLLCFMLVLRLDHCMLEVHSNGLQKCYVICRVAIIL